MDPRQNKRPSPRRRSADFQSAVSPICNRQSVQKPSASGLGDGPQNTILRYSRLKICATTYEISGPAELPAPDAIPLKTAKNLIFFRSAPSTRRNAQRAVCQDDKSGSRGE